MEKTENGREIDGYRVILERWGKYRVENPKTGKYVWKQLNEDVDYENTDECWEQIGHDIYDQNPNLYLEELGDPAEKHEMDWNEGQIEIQDEYGNFRNVIVINDGTVQYWAILDRPVNEAIADFCRTYYYTDEHEGENLELGMTVYRRDQRPLP